jgi:hypothetical protein
MNSSSSTANPLKTPKKRFGLMKIQIDSNHIIKGPDGINRQFKTRDLTRNNKAKYVAVCLACKKTWENEEELMAAHPDERILRKQEEAHPYGFWSDEPLEKGNKDPAKVVGLLSDLEIG